VTAKIEVAVEIKITDEDLDAASTPVVHKIKKTFEAVDDYTLKRFKINNDTQVVWDAAGNGEPISSFQGLFMWSDGVLDCEATGNNGDANEELASFRLAPGVVYGLGADDSYYNHSASDVYAGTLDVIDLLRVKEDNSEDVNLWVLLIE